MLKISIGSDHGGYIYKAEIIKYLKQQGYIVIDCGTDSQDSCDYPFFGFKTAEMVSKKEADFGIVICTSGEGIMIAANKVDGIRCGIGYNDEVARLLREHNDANMISFGAKEMDLEDVKRRIDIFLNTPFSNGIRHERRVEMINTYKK